MMYQSVVQLVLALQEEEECWLARLLATLPDLLVCSGG